MSLKIPIKEIWREKQRTIILIIVILASLILLPFDLPIVIFIANLRHPTLNILFVYFTNYGNYIFAVIEGIILVLCSKSKEKQKYSIAIIFSYVGWFVSSRIVSSLKIITQRPRPYKIAKNLKLSGTWAGGYSFPSGHSASAFSLSVPLIIETKSRIIKIVLIFFAILMAFSRVYCGVHYPTDILWGSYIGYIISSSIYNMYKSKRHNK
ncbi:MAG: phosphatase PAP2 family protein [Candidatus Njordarchaeota archaeon]